MVLAVTAAALLLQIAPLTAAVPAVKAPMAAAYSAASNATTSRASAISGSTPKVSVPAVTSAADHAKLVTLADDTSAAALPAEPVQSTQSLSNIRIPASKSEKRSDTAAAETPSRRQWLLLSMAQSGAAAFDAYSTRQSIATGAAEEDPMMRPFAHSPAIYGAIQVAPLVLDYFARRMQRSSNSFVRRTWWLPQSMGTATFVFSGAHNLGVAAR